MKRILHFEIDKLFRQKSFYICTMISALMILITSISTNALTNGVGQSGWLNASGVISASQFQLIFSIFMALFICSDFSENTIKNIYGHGFSREQVYAGKYLSSLLSMVIMFVVDIVVAFLVGSVLWGTGEISNIPLLLLRRFVILFKYHGFIFMISMIITKIGSVIAINIVGPMMISLVLALIDNVFSFEKVKLAEYSFDSLMSKVGDVSSATGEISIALVLAIIYGVIFVCIGFFVNRKVQL